MIRLIVGLGNPGADYASTRHNAGAWLVTELAKRCQISLTAEKKFKGSTAQVILQGQTCRLFIPLTYMNVSGQAVLAIAYFYRLTPEQILVVHDELDLPVGVAKLKFSGGHGGHNGLLDIFSTLASQNFYRLRIGIGKPVIRNTDIAAYVLQVPTRAERTAIDVAIDKAIGVIALLVTGNPSAAIKALHTKSETEPNCTRIIGKSDGL